ncbi:MAG TPA: pseudouridine-5'-phosphate glycosidase [Urbifossiella sp.]|jgi:pseudouridine-5'-phosphate glycosidase|nr:pseudouridine-5'-phosphate glycosidase [Urbifossiella sp.]
MAPDWLTLGEEVAAALAAGRPVVALESTLVAHGLPWPANLVTARAAEAAVRAGGAVPATAVVWHGRPTLGLAPVQLEELARTPGVFKASRRDLGAAVGLGRLAATTVSATMALAHAAGVRVFATGGIGGAHRSAEGSAPRTADAWDISADLTELGRTPVLVVCAGAKSILDLPRTLEILETLGVPVLGYRTDRFPQFYVADSATGESLPVSARVESATEAAAAFDAHVCLGGGGAVLAQHCPADVAVPPDEFEAALGRALADAHRAKAHGPKATPFILARVAELTGGRTLVANRALIVANAALAAGAAVALTTSRGARTCGG